MERTLNQEERQRRAEELYYRRKNSLNSARTTTVNVNPKKNYKLLKKIIIQVVICASIYGIIYKLQSNSDTFSIDSINYLKNTMSYDININRTFENIKDYMSSFSLLSNGKNINNEEENAVNEEAVIENKLKEATLAASEQIIENTNSKQQTINTEAEEASSVNQIGEDAEYIKNNFSFIKPITGTVTSRFGPRNPTTATVPKYHTGIDIGVPEGTVFVAAMEGTVELVSSVGDYRKSFENNKWGCINTLCTL